MRDSIVGGLAAVAVAALVAQAAAGPRQQQQPSFRVSTDVVAVDVGVVGRDGAPVRDLQPDDLIVRVDGQPRRIVSMQLVGQTTAPARAAGTEAPTTRGRVSSNHTATTDRLILIVIDETSIEPGQLRAAADSVGQLLATLGPGDRVGLAVLPGPRMLVRFSGDRRRVAEAMKRVVGSGIPRSLTSRYQVGVAEAFAVARGDPATTLNVIERECQDAGGGRASQVGINQCVQQIKSEAVRLSTEVRQQGLNFAEDLRVLLRDLAPIEEPKLLIVFSTGLMSPEVHTDLAYLSAASAAARAAIYAVRLDRTLFDVSQMRSPAVMSQDRVNGGNGLGVMVDRARGAVFDVMGSAQVPLARLALEISAYYLIGIDATASDRDGRPHRISVETSRPGLAIRARPEFTFTPSAPSAARRTDDASIVRRALASPVLAADLPVRVTTFNLADEDPARVRIVVLAEIDREQSQSDSAVVSYALSDQDGRTTAGFSERVNLATNASGSLVFTSVVSVPAGGYTLKLAAMHRERVGSIEHPFDAELLGAGSLELGDFVIGDPPRGAGQALSATLDAHLRGDRVWGFVSFARERLDKSAGTVDLALEIAKQRDGPALVTTQVAVEESGRRVRIGQADLDGRLLPPGDYIARLTLSVSGKHLHTLVSPFTFERRLSSGGAAEALDVGTFEVRQVLEPAIVGPFLDRLSVEGGETASAAVAQAREGRFDEAVRALKAGKGSDAAAPFIRGLALLSHSRLQDASGAFREAIGAAPDFLVGAFYIGACYAAGGRDQDAIDAWQTSLVGLEDFPIVYRLLAEALVRKGETEHALEVLKEASDRWPDDTDFATRVARVAIAGRRYEQAGVALARLVERQPRDEETLFLAMRAAFESAADAATSPEWALSTLRRYAGMYAAAHGSRQALVAEWVRFVETRAKK